jgi:TetR/AcrR family transcriptional regulator, acrAB operon repressor
VEPLWAQEWHRRTQLIPALPGPGCFRAIPVCLVGLDLDWACSPASAGALPVWALRPVPGSERPVPVSYPGPASVLPAQASFLATLASLGRSSDVRWQVPCGTPRPSRGVPAGVRAMVVGMSRQAEISAESRARLVAATWELLAEGGSRAATVQAVAERAGISRGSIAWHFGSKEGLVVAVVNSAFDMLCDRIAEAFDQSGGSGWGHMLAAEAVALNDERFRIFGTLALEAITEQGPVASAFIEGHRRVRDLYADQITKQGLVVDGVDPRDVAAALRAMTLGLNIQRRFDDDIISLERAFGALQGVVPEARAAAAPKRIRAGK